MTTLLSFLPKVRLRCDQNRKPLNNGRNKVKAATVVVLSELFHMKRTAKDGTKGFSLLRLALVSV